MGKVRTTIRMNEDVVKMAKKLGVNISAFTEMKLLEYFKDLENLRRESNNPGNKSNGSERQSNGRNSQDKNLWTCRDLNPRPPPCQGA